MLEELKEAGIELPEVEVKNLSLMDGDQFFDEFTAVNPNQKIPGLVDGDVRIMEDVPAEQKSHPLTHFNNEAQRLYRVLNKQLEGQDYVCGDQSTIADIAIYPWVRAWKWQKVDITGHHNVMAWLERVRARPGVERGVKYCVPPEEAHQWSEERKRQVARAGATIASNANIQSAGK